VYNEISVIRNKVIDKIILISLVFLTPAYLSSFARWIEMGFQNISFIHSVLYVFLVALIVFKRRLSTEVKIYSMVFVFTVLGIAALWYYGFSGIHYFVIIAIAIASILAERKAAFILIALLAIMYIVVGLMYMLNKHQPAVDLNKFSHSILQWTTILFSLIAFSAVFAEGFGELYHRLIRTIENNREIQNRLEFQNKELIQTKQDLAKKVEEFHEVNLQLQLSEDKYKKLVNYSPDIIYWYSTLNGGLFFSERVKKILGYEPKELEESPGLWKDLIHPEDIKELQKSFSDYDPDLQYDLVYRVKTKSGNWKWLSDTLTTLKYTEDEIIFQGHLADITEKKITEQKLKESELRWQFSVDGSDLGLWDWNILTNEIFFSKQWKNMLGYAEDEIEGNFDAWEKRLHPDDIRGVIDTLNAYLRGESKSYDNEIRMLCKDGSYKWIHDKGKIVSYTKEGKPKRMIGTHADITEKKLAELELKKSNATKDRFFSIIAHDLKNPFNSMLGLSEILNENFDELDVKTQKKFVAGIHEGIIKTYDLLEDLLLWSRAQRNTLDFYPKPVDLHMTLSEVLETLQLAADNKSIEFIAQVMDGTIVVADNFMLSFILRNLIMNAIKFTPQNGKITIESTFLDREGNKLVQIAVKDTGIGMDRKYMEHIFDIGQNVSRPGTENEKGTGMGLPICSDFVTKHGGKMWVESSPEEGSQFFFTLPVDQNQIA